MKAMRLEQPDRIPVAEFVIDERVYRALMPDAVYQSDFEERFELDTVTARNEYEISDETESVFIDEWGVKYKKNKEKVMLPLEGPIKTFDDVKKYRPPDPDKPKRLGRLRELVKRYKGEKAVVFHQRETFLWSTYLTGMENLLISFIQEPDLAHELLEKVLDVNIRLARNAISEGADIIVISDDYAYNDGLLFSPAIFKEFIEPGLKRMVDAIHKEGALVIKHSDGDLSLILDDIVGTGIDALNPIDPQAGMDIAKVKKDHGGRVCIWGNIDCSRLLSFGSLVEVEESVKECINAAGENGGYVLTSSNSIHSSVKPENYLAMLKAARRYGKYPD